MRLHVPISLRWSDLDAYGHVNNAAIFGLLEEARIHAFWAGDKTFTGASDNAAPVTRIFRGGPDADTITLIARQQAEYLAPIPYLRDPLDVEMWIGSLGGASMDVCYEIFSPTGVTPRVLFARALTTIVVIDAAAQKPRRITDSERAVIEQIVDAPLVFRNR
jgi:acyl-CoA thioester hydrolase